MITKERSDIERFIIQEAEELVNNKIKGLSLGFTDIQDYRFSADFGNFTKGSSFQIASITKIITGIAVMQLVEQGKLNLNDNIIEYIPQLSEKYKDIIVLDLLRHTSGLSRDIMNKGQGLCPFSENEIIKYLNDHIAVMPVSYRYSYSNIGFELAGMIIENLTDLSYTEYIEENILKILGMKGSSFDQTSLTAPVYTLFNDEEYFEYPINYTSAGGMVSNIDDILNLAEIFLREESILLSRESRHNMLKIQNENIALDTDIQMGIVFYLEDLDPPLKGKLAYHGGSGLFVNAILMLAPEYGMGTFIYSNTAGSYNIIENLARDIIHKAIEKKHGLIASPHKASNLKIHDSKDKEIITGNYITPFMLIRINSSNGDYRAEIRGNSFPIKFYENGFFSYNDNFFLKVKKIHDEKVLFIKRDSILSPIGKEEKLSFPINKHWLNAIGKYSIIEPCPAGNNYYYETLEIKKIDGILYIAMMPQEITRQIFGIESPIMNIIDAISSKKAIMKGFGRYAGEPVYLHDNEIIFSGLRFQKN